MSSFIMLIDVNYDLDDILNSNDCYNDWYLITKYIIDKYPKAFLLDLLKDRNKAHDFLKNEYKEIKNYYLNFKDK